MPNNYVASNLFAGMVRTDIADCIRDAKKEASRRSREIRAVKKVIKGTTVRNIPERKNAEQGVERRDFHGTAPFCDREHKNNRQKVGTQKKPKFCIKMRRNRITKPEKP